MAIFMYGMAQHGLMLVKLLEHQEHQAIQDLAVFQAILGIQELVVFLDIQA